MTAYYNERDPFAAQWLRNLVAAGLIAPGHVDDRSIEEVKPDDVRGYVQCHWFAGIAGWSLALRLAGWDDARPLWTGSCPCQPFSAAGKGKAADDERHLWPCWFSLIRECRPPTVFGEQVEAAIGWGWLDAVFSDLEAEGYACGAAVLPAASVGAPHIRQRLWFVADAQCKRSEARTPTAECASRPVPRGDGGNGRLAHPDGRHSSPEGLQRGGQHGLVAEDGRADLMGDAIGSRLEGRPRERGDDGPQRPPLERAGDEPCPLVNAPGEQVGLPGRPWLARSANPWSDLEWLPCTDGKARPTRPGLFPLAHGVSARVGKLRAAGNAIVPQVAAEFIKATMV